MACIKPTFAYAMLVTITSAMWRFHAHMEVVPLECSGLFISIRKLPSPISTGLSPREHPTSNRERICVARLFRPRTEKLPYTVGNKYDV